MRQTKPTIEDCKATEDMHHLRLMSVLKELVREKESWRRRGCWGSATKR